MSWNIEESILQRALKEGYIQLDALLEKGVISQETLDRLMGELTSEQPNAPESPVRPSPHTTVETFGRYSQMELLGQGGAARVYRAFDPSLGREIALKFLRVDDEEIRKRFLHEARAQARIEHNHVCKIYEAGEIEGRPYIAMQLIRGKSLLEIRAQLTLEQKVLLMKEVADAVHAAHRAGLIHRDIKPANIIVEFDSDNGRWVPYVTDFGIAREIDAAGLTSTGMILGTIHYMAPEQARGKVHELDRRTDVYGLGATLYQILSGSLPYDPDNPADYLVHLLNQEPVTLSKRFQKIPPDLELIAMKAIQKDPSERYDSARAFAEDLQRYLDGEQILARRANLKDRIYKKLKKHKALTTTVTAAIIVLAILFGLWLDARNTATEKALLSRRFGQEIERIESTMRYAYMLPIHNIRFEQSLVEQRIRRVEQQMKEIGDAATGPGNYALGRGYLALHNFEKAINHLSKAWNSGYQEPEVAQALGLATSHLYQLELERSRMIGNKKVREKKRADLERKFRDPALSYLRISQSSDAGTADYIEALIAFLEKDYDTAHTLTEKTQRIPWFYEGKILAAQVEEARGSDQRDKGENAAAQKLYESAEQHYRAAMLKGESDPEVYAKLCELKISQIIMQKRQTQTSPKETFEAALAVCNQALQIDPEHTPALLSKSEVYWNYADYIRYRGEDATPYLTESIATSEKLIALEPENSSAHISRGIAYWMKSEVEILSGKDPTPSIDQAIKSYEKARSGDSKDPNIYLVLGNSYVTKGFFEIFNGKDPSLTFDKATQSFQEVIRIMPEYESVYNNMGNAYLGKGEYEFVSGNNPTNTLLQAVASYEKAISINPKSSHPMVNMASACNHIGYYLIKTNASPMEFVTKARKVLENAGKIQPDLSDIFRLKGDTIVLEARWMGAQKPESSDELFQEAELSLKEAVRLNPKSADAYESLASLYRHKAEWEAATKQPNSESIARGFAMVTKALELNPQMFRAVALKGTLHALKSEHLAAKAELEKAFTGNPLLRTEFHEIYARL